jgi:hypothetical protein
METLEKDKTKTFEERFEMLMKSFEVSREEYELAMKKSREEHELAIKKSREEHELAMKEMREFQAKTGRQIDKLHEQIGGISNNQGAFAEEYFFNSFEKGEKNFFGEKFEEISKHLKNK